MAHHMFPANQIMQFFDAKNESCAVSPPPRSLIHSIVIDN